jgi:serine/threonine-protein kinase RsbW
VAMGRQRFDGPSAVGAARAYAREVLRGAVAEEVIDDVLLCVSELATNAVRHAHAERFLLKVWADLRRVRVECHDRSGTWPLLRSPGTEATSGRGLLLVDGVTSRWGVRRRRFSQGKYVWFEIDVDRPQPALPERRPAC